MLAAVIPPATAILFDMDGTLVESEPLWQQAEADLVCSRGYKLDKALHASFTGLVSPQVIELIRDAYGLSESKEHLLAELYERLLSRLEMVKTREGMAPVLSLVSKHAVPRALVSNSALAIIEAALKNQTWASMFNHRYSAEQVERAKPAPDLYLHAAAQLGVEPEACLVLEDSLAGVQAAVAAGMTCIAVPETEVEPFYKLTPHVYKDLERLAADMTTALD